MIKRYVLIDAAFVTNAFQAGVARNGDGAANVSRILDLLDNEGVTFVTSEYIDKS